MYFLLLNFFFLSLSLSLFCVRFVCLFIWMWIWIGVGCVWNRISNSRLFHVCFWVFCCMFWLVCICFRGTPASNRMGSKPIVPCIHSVCECFGIDSRYAGVSLYILHSSLIRWFCGFDAHKYHLISILFFSFSRWKNDAGGLFWGSLSDKIGRQTPFTISALVCGVSGVGSAFAPEFYSFLVLRSIMSFGLSGFVAVGACHRLFPHLHLLFLFPSTSTSLLFVILFRFVLLFLDRVLGVSFLLLYVLFWTTLSLFVKSDFIYIMESFPSQFRGRIITGVTFGGSLGVLSVTGIAYLCLEVLIFLWAFLSSTSYELFYISERMSFPNFDILSFRLLFCLFLIPLFPSILFPFLHVTFSPFVWIIEWKWILFFSLECMDRPLPWDGDILLGFHPYLLVS